MGKFRDYLDSINEGSVFVKRASLAVTDDDIKKYCKENNLTIDTNKVIGAFKGKLYSSKWVEQVIICMADSIKNKSTFSYQSIIKLNSMAWGGTKDDFIIIANKLGFIETARKFSYVEGNQLSTVTPVNNPKSITDAIVFGIKEENKAIILNGIPVVQFSQYHTSSYGDDISEIFKKLIGDKALIKLKNSLSAKYKDVLFSNDGLYSYAGGGKISSQVNLFKNALESATEYLSTFLNVDKNVSTNGQYTKVGTIKISVKANVKEDPRKKVAMELYKKLQGLSNDFDNILSELRKIGDISDDNNIPTLAYSRLKGNIVYDMSKIDFSTYENDIRNFIKELN